MPCTGSANVIEWGISFAGFAAALPINCELIQTDVAATVTQEPQQRLGLGLLAAEWHRGEGDILQYFYMNSAEAHHDLYTEIRIVFETDHEFDIKYNTALQR